jgi:hypothetical protein
LLESWKHDELSRRLSPFTDAGLLKEIPTPWQVLQGTFAMTPYVLSSDAVLESRYRGAPFAHPFMRQPLLLAVCGIDHLRVGPAFDAKLSSVCKHLYLTYHWGMPVFDLQVIQTHPNGLATLRKRTEAMLANETRAAQRMRRLQALILPRGDDYLPEFLGNDGWIARAERFDYPDPAAETSVFPPEFFSLVTFLNHCAASYAATRDGMPARKVPAHLYSLWRRRAREGRTFGWLPSERRKMMLPANEQDPPPPE